MLNAPSYGTTRFYWLIANKKRYFQSFTAKCSGDGGFAPSLYPPTLEPLLPISPNCSLQPRADRDFERSKERQREIKDKRERECSRERERKKGKKKACSSRRRIRWGPWARSRLPTSPPNKFKRYPNHPFLFDAWVSTGYLFLSRVFVIGAYSVS